MFFNVGPSQLDNFPVHYQHNNLHINLDTGWHETNDNYGNKIFYKGYLDQGPLKDYIEIIADQEEPLFFGNFCILKCFNQGVSIKTDRLRSFPIFYNKTKGINNLIPYDYTCWTDSFVTLLDNLDKLESKFNLVTDQGTSVLSFEEVLNRIDLILTEKISRFATTLNQPIKVFLSGGIDTTALFSYVRKLGIPYELINYFHTDLDYFYLKNHGDLGKFWGYKQFHYWKEPSVLLSGTPGDEFTVRSPTTANMLLKFYGTDIPSLTATMPNSLHTEYFKKYTDLFKTQQNLSFDSLNDVILQCLNIVINDWQHWHLGNTISYTPLRDISIFSNIAKLDKDQLVEQIMGSKIQLKLIEKNCPDLLEILSIKKNSDNYLENLTKILT